MQVTGLQPVEHTAFITLDARARDARHRRPLLADPWAIKISEQLDYDRSQLGMTDRSWRKGTLNAAVRGRILDRLIMDFVSDHPSAQVVDLGAGLDSSRYRLDIGPDVAWYDIDLPMIIELRRQLYPARPDHHDVVADLGTDAGWLELLDPDRPTFLVGDGFLPFLPTDALIRLLRQLTGRLGYGELAANGYSRFSSRVLPSMIKGIRTLGIPTSPGLDDPLEPTRWVPELELVAVHRLINSDTLPQWPAAQRIPSRIMRAIPALARADKGVLHYRFGALRGTRQAD